MVIADEMKSFIVSVFYGLALLPIHFIRSHTALKANTDSYVKTLCHDSLCRQVSLCHQAQIKLR